MYTKLCKNGKLIYVESDDKSIDVTNDALKYLFLPCVLENDVRLRDIYLFVERYVDIIDSIVGCYCKEIILEGLSNIETNSIPEDLKYLELYWFIDVDNDGMSGNLFPSFIGVGTEDNHISIALSSSSCLINLPVVLSNQFTICDHHIGESQYRQIVYNNPEYSLIDIIYGIIWELSFFGSPANREKYLLELDDTVETNDI